MSERTGRRVQLATLCALALALGAVVLTGATRAALVPTPETLRAGARAAPAARVLARDGTTLSVSYRGRWNVDDHVALHDVPARLRQAFLVAEDARFFAHGGIDWIARAHAAWQNLRAGALVRGASTITEQLARILTPRPRTAWSRWLETLEARRLEARFSKADILEAYLNQVPYGANRRGVAQGARYYFDRDLDTLSSAEMLALAVLVRAPSGLDPYRGQGPLLARVRLLADRMHGAGVLDRPARDRVLATRALALASAELALRAPHFVRAAREAAARSPEVGMPGRGPGPIRTSLDAGLQRHVQRLLDQRLADLADRRVANGAALVVEHASGAVRAWAVGGNGAEGWPGAQVDAVRTPRQPGSTLKPFVYALALERGWTAATMIDDAPLAEMVGRGLHAYRNYSRRHHGPVSLRDALGSSLNVPAVKALQHVGAAPLLGRLRELGVRSLDAHPDRYGDGLALGNGEVTLRELVEAYVALARGGAHVPLSLDGAPGAVTRVLSFETASIVADILADPDARALEFSRGGVLRLPVETAVKTGTSSGHRDAWAVGFDHAHTVGIWLGNLDGTAMDGVTGARGPALALREIFAHLSHGRPGAPLPRSRRLVRHPVCLETGLPADGACVERPEWFVPGTEPEADFTPAAAAHLRLRHPTPGLDMAMDPRIPDALERFELALTEGPRYARVRWRIDGRVVAETDEPRWPWPLVPGSHLAEAEVLLEGAERWVRTEPVRFRVKGPSRGSVPELRP